MTLLIGTILGLQGYLDTDDLWGPLKLPIEVVKLICIVGWVPMLIAAIVSLVLRIRASN